jgi:CRP/FNR family transcriptional regulator, cyclic AMP receptor protein
MIDITNLRAIIMLSYLTDPMLKKLEEVTLIKKYGEKEFVFKEGEYAEHLFAVIEGRVSLELAKNPSRHISILEVTKGMAFGMASLVDTENRKYIGYAKTTAPTRVFAWRGADLDKLFVQDYEMGFLIMKRAANILNRRMEISFAQFVDLCL